MRTLEYLILLLCIVSSQLIQAQEDQSINKQEDIPVKFNFITASGFGYGIINSEDKPDYNVNISTGEILLNYRFNNVIGLASGIGYTALSGNSFNSLGNFYHTRELLSIPLILTAKRDFTDRFRIAMEVSLYAQTILRDKYSYLDFNQKDLYDGWNFGSQISFAFLFEVLNNYYLGLNYKMQSDFSKLSTTSNATTQDKQALWFNSIGFIFMFDI